MLDKIIYRLKQFYFGMFSLFTPEDKIFVEDILSGQALLFFIKLPDFEKKHSVVVARKMLAIARSYPELDTQKLARLGLLHDIGKIYEKNSVMSKSVLVIIRFLSPWLYQLLADRGKTDLRFRRFYFHKHHGAAGAELLAKIGESSDIVAAVSKHDPRIEPFGPGDPLELKILQQADSTY